MYNEVDAVVFKLTVKDVKCMHDRGEQGSNLERFNNASVSTAGGGGAFPPDGPQYIEANSATTHGSPCATDASYFTLWVEELGVGVTIKEWGNLYSVESLGYFTHAKIDNDCDPAKIDVTFGPIPEGRPLDPSDGG